MSLPSGYTFAGENLHPRCTADLLVERCIVMRKIRGPHDLEAVLMEGPVQHVERFDYEEPDTYSSDDWPKPFFDLDIPHRCSRCEGLIR